LMLTAAAGGIKNAPRRRRIIRKLAWRAHRTRRDCRRSWGIRL
jgi:hypothetical protein